MKFEVFPRATVRGRRWYWRLVAANGEIIAASQGYRNRVDALHAVDLVRSVGPSTTVNFIDRRGYAAGGEVRLARALLEAGRAAARGGQ